MALPRYHLHLPAYLPTGPFMGDGKTRAHELHEGGAHIDYAGEPNLAWTPLNEQAVEAQRAYLKALIAKLEEAISFLDPASARSRAMLKMKVDNHKKHLADLKVSEPPEAKAKADALLDELTMVEANKATPVGQPLKTGRPSDSGNRR
jgi:hypothetical protein